TRNDAVVSIRSVFRQKNRKAAGQANGCLGVLSAALVRLHLRQWAKGPATSKGIITYCGEKSELWQQIMVSRPVLDIDLMPCRQINSDGSALPELAGTCQPRAGLTCGTTRQLQAAQVFILN
ncbi:hypothetical protein KDL29_15950, partial [bacterium]|nr:hypothetical protein [bacterium]